MRKRLFPHAGQVGVALLALLALGAALALPGARAAAADSITGIMGVTGLDLVDGVLMPPRVETDGAGDPTIGNSPYDSWDSTLERMGFGLVRMLYHTEDETTGLMGHRDGTGGHIASNGGIRAPGLENDYLDGFMVGEETLGAVNGAISETLGAGHSLQSLYDQGLYVKYADSVRAGGQEQAYVVLSNLVLNDAAAYNRNVNLDPLTGELRPGAANVPLAVFGPGGVGVLLVPEGSKTVTDGGDGLYAPLYRVHQTPDGILDPGDYLWAVLSSARALENLDLEFAGGLAYAFTPAQLASQEAFLRSMREELDMLGVEGSSLALDNPGFGMVGDWRAWAGTNFVQDRQTEKGSYRGYVYNEYSLTLGLDRRLLDGHLFGGLAAGFARGRLSDSRAFRAGWDYYLDVIHAGAYAGWSAGYAFVNAGAGYDWFSYRPHVGGGTLDRSVGSSWGGFLEAGYRIDRVDYLVIPTVGLEYSRINPAPAVSEGSWYGLDMGAAKALRTPVRLTVRKPLTDWTSLAVHAGYLHNWKSDASVDYAWILGDDQHVRRFGMRGESLPADTYELGFAVGYSQGAFAASLKYDFQWWGSNNKSNHRGHNVRAEAGWAW